MKTFDLHSHWGTERGYPIRRKDALALQRKNWNSEAKYHSETEMAAYLRKNDVSAVLDFGFTKFGSLDEIRALHDYAFEVQDAYPEEILGHWIHVDPRHGTQGVLEFRRCIDRAPRFIGLGVNGSGGLPASDPAYQPFFELCIEANVPALIFVGTTNQGAGLPGGGGVLLDTCHPRHLDAVAVAHPGLTIVAGRPAWPWQAETIAVLLHKQNIWYELHGWSPKYHTPDLRHDIARRLQDRVMFGADYPLITYERLFADWRAEGYSEQVLEKVFHRNALAFLQSMGRDAWISA